ncbi:MAG: SGNH/GDSL hydrolase family protein [Thiomonas sp.]|uniref:SGNH/GDSL hydrolase family protein n=1 Tax=Thiomonas sp. TaxID=2047785 RepID=UPI002A36C9AD|nr:SGNH/GDSL hydrolase family protein [Thiomonas sp.]MDY0330168.1 SGNH/GDSL hydrolase family protein [Thiomonas sp.]
MHNRIWIALALASALGLTGCGGGGNPSPPSLASVSSVNAASTAPKAAPSGGFKQVVAFGDSLSDDGAYTLAALSVYGPGTSYNIPFTGLPYAAGGQFTVNGAATGNWTNVLASKLGLSLTPNLVGYGTPSGVMYLGAAGTTSTPAFCAFSAPPSSGQANCTNFAEGGSMVSNPDGIGHSGGALTLPITTQVQNYLAQFGSFNANQLVTVLAGNNDIFAALSGVSASVTLAVQQAVGSALQQNPSLTQAQIAQIQAEAQAQATSQAVAAAQTTVATAADQLAAQVKLISSKGGQYVLVFTLPDSSQTPFGRGLPYTGMTPPQAPPAGYVCDNTNTSTPCYLLSNLVQVFNQRLLNDLQGQPVKVLDGYGLLNEEIANPAQFGLSNVTTPWCDPATTSSLLCNVGTPYAAAGASTSNLGTWLFADSLHPTPTGYGLIANAALSAMKGFGWISQ